MMSGDDLRYLVKVRADISRAMADTRFPAPNRFGGDLRMFVVTAIWVLGVERAPKGERIKRVCEVMHLDDFRFWELVRSDLPRYEPESLHGNGGCRGWMPRAQRRCGKGTTTAFRVTNPADGTWELAGYCSAHRGEAVALAGGGKLVRLDGRTVPAQMLAAQIALLKAASTYGLERVITYHHRVLSAARFAATLPNAFERGGRRRRGYERQHLENAAEAIRRGDLEVPEEVAAWTAA